MSSFMSSMSRPFNMEEYFRLNVEKKAFIKVPEQEEHDLTPATRLLEKRREMLEIENGLAQQKEEFAIKMDSLSQRRDELVRKESQLKESLSKFDKFLKENDAKRTRALRKALEERRLKEQKESEIYQIKDSLNEVTSKKERQAKALETNLAYQRYLESTVEAVEEFSEIKDLLARYDTLAATNAELLERARVAQERMEFDRQIFLHSTEEKNNTVLNYNNEIAKLQTKLEESQLKSAKWQQEWDQALKHATEKSLLLGQIKMATNNLFNIVKSHLNNRLNSTTDTLVQLDKIQQFILDLTQITAELQEAVGSGSGATAAGGPGT
ncbi:Cilia- and flagella-associated protein 73, partial [Quaeritorhiza haematococci]